jgi:hypothetical protein
MEIICPLLLIPAGVVLGWLVSQYPGGFRR